ncbi:MAG TPA: Crp/Fnr family transcriptional regulator [Isosphaeraceae bacterium]|nr:Crp/Fnr family transcriptional regulator [Isosphaeraceae bacterium]
MDDSEADSLRQCSLFRRLTPEQLAAVGRRATLRAFRKGELIDLPGDPAPGAWVVADGRVKIKSITPEGKELILAFLGEGEVFGELALVDDGPRTEFAEATVATRALALAREEPARLAEQVPGLALQVGRLLGLRRLRAESRLRNLMFRSNRRRVAGVLLELLEGRPGRQPQGPPRAARRGGPPRAARGPRPSRRPILVDRAPLSHQDLAGLVGSTRETVTIVLGRLQSEGLIRVRRRSILVLDRQGLAAGAVV